MVDHGHFRLGGTSILYGVVRKARVFTKKYDLFSIHLENIGDKIKKSMEATVRD